MDVPRVYYLTLPGGIEPSTYRLLLPNSLSL